MQKILLSFLFFFFGFVSPCFSFDEYLKESAYKGGTELIRATLENDLAKMQKVLLEDPHTVNERDNYLHAPALLYAIENNNIEAVKLLLKYNADIEVSYDFEGGPTLIMSAKGQILELLIEHGAEIDYYVVEGENPFGSAVRRGDVESMQIYLKHGVKAKLSSIMDEGSANCDYALACFIQGAESASYYGTSEDELIEVLKLLIELGADIYANIEHYNNPSQSLLMYMAESNSTKIMQFLLDKGVDVNAKDFEGKTALDYAVKSSNANAIELLLNQKNDVQVSNDILFALARDNNIERMQFFIDKGADVNAKDKDGNTALFYAVIHGQGEAIEFLLKNNADVRAKFVNENTVLTSLMYNSNNKEPENLLKSLNVLIEAGADIHSPNSYGVTPLMNMLRLKVYDGFTYDWDAVPCIEGMQILLAKGADINARNSEGQNILQWGLSKADDMYRTGLAHEVIDFLLAQGLDIQAKDNKGNNALHYAIPKGKIDTFKILLDKGIDINAQNNTGQTALMLGIGFKSEEVEFFVKNGAKVNIQDNNGITALMSAARYFNTERTEALLKNKADIHLKDKAGNKALSYTRYSDFVNVPLFVQYKANINEKNAEGRTLLMDAQSFNIEKLLSIKGINLEVKDEAGTTALIMALDPNKVEDLLNAGAKVNAVNKDGITALMICAYYDVYESVELLLKHNAKLNIKDSDGMTALSYAEMQENTKIVELLKRHGAK